MDPVIDERAVVRACLREHVGIRYANGDIQNEAVFDEASELCVGGQLALRGRPRGRAAPWWAVGHFVERGVLSAVSMLWDGA